MAFWLFVKKLQIVCMFGSSNFVEIFSANFKNIHYG